MSYILDALRRAEAERGRGTVPGLHSPATPPGGPATVAPSGRQSRWVGLAAVLLLALGAGLGWWLRPVPAAAPPAADAAVAATATPAASVPAASPPRLAPSATTPDAVAATVSLPAPLARPAAPAPVVAATRLAVPTPVAADVNSTRPPSSAATGQTAARAPAATAGRASAPPPAAAPHLNALPAELRQSLPPLKLGGAMYSDNAESRVLVLNDQLWHEGEYPAPELLLERIQPHAAQLNFRGQRFQLTY